MTDRYRLTFVCMGNITGLPKKQAPN